MRQQRLGLLFTVLGASLFGTLGIFGKVVTTIELSTATLLVVRFVAATAIFWLLLAASGKIRVLRGRLFGAEFGLGIVYGIMTISYFEGLRWLSAGVAALLLFTYPVQVTLGSALTLDEPVTVPKLLALVAAVTGVALVVGGEIEFAWIGLALMLIASLCYTIYSMATRVLMIDIGPLVHAAHTFLGVTTTLLAYGVFTSELAVPTSDVGWGLIGGITIVGTVVPILLYSAGLARIEASRASIASTSEPLTTVGLGVVFLGETVTVTIGIGAVLILSGVVLTAPAVERVIRRRLEGFETGRVADRKL